jgi:ubiquinone/menaquinone biosynthesis C-methylase UbiE
VTQSPTSSRASLSPDEIALERSQQVKYRFYYSADGLDHASRPAHDYFAKLAARKLGLVRQQYAGGPVVDLCCGAGDYLLPVAEFTDSVTGVDFSPELLATAHRRIVERGVGNAHCLTANARALPLREASAALAFAFSSLYYIPRVEQVVAECARILRPGGIAILDFGLRYSLNTLVCRAHPELAEPCHLPLRSVCRMLENVGLGIEADHAFQLLPLWGDRPAWLRPLLHPRWKRLLATELRGRMLDEWVSGCRLLHRMAFRHILVCRKGA